MQATPLNRVISKETKYYGLKVVGLFSAAILGMLVLLGLNMTAGIMASVAGYGFGSYVSSNWHQGKWQRWLYWHLPVARSFGGKYLPPSHKRRFM
jgi:hypothetical protein